MVQKPVFENFPEQNELMHYRSSHIREVNAHIHTPYSFSAFNDLEEPFLMAAAEKVEVLGINDFTTTKGYDEFLRKCFDYHIFPLFNIEFIGLLEEEQHHGILINDPNNPGRTYFSGKGLRYPYVPPAGKESFLDDLVNKNTDQVRLMVDKANEYFDRTVPGLHISFEKIHRDLAVELVRERHVAKAIRLAVAEKYPGPAVQIEVYTKLFGGKTPVSGLYNPAKLENEIRSRLLKQGGPAYIPEDTAAFPVVHMVRDFILESGGIPCYPVLLDNPQGEFTGFEKNKEKLADILESMNVFAVEFIPGRNDCRVLNDYAEYFYGRGFLVMFGTEHNTPEMIPLRVQCRHHIPLPENLKTISYHSACMVAAHQYLIARGEEGYCLPDGRCRIEERDEFIALGDGVIGYFQNLKE